MESVKQMLWTRYISSLWEKAIPIVSQVKIFLTMPILA